MNSSLHKLISDIEVRPAYIDHEILNEQDEHIAIKASNGWFTYDKNYGYKKSNHNIMKHIFEDLNLLDRFNEMDNKIQLIIELNDEQKEILISNIKDEVLRHEPKDINNYLDYECLDMAKNFIANAIHADMESMSKEIEVLGNKIIHEFKENEFYLDLVLDKDLTKEDEKIIEDFNNSYKSNNQKSELKI